MAFCEELLRPLQCAVRRSHGHGARAVSAGTTVEVLRGIVIHRRIYPGAAWLSVVDIRDGLAGHEICYKARTAYHI
eukprot:s4758_g1.t1